MTPEHITLTAGRATNEPASVEHVTIAAQSGADSYQIYSVMFYGICRWFEVRATSLDAALADLRSAYADLGEVLTWNAR